MYFAPHTDKGFSVVSEYGETFDPVSVSAALSQAAKCPLVSLWCFSGSVVFQWGALMYGLRTNWLQEVFPLPSHHYCLVGLTSLIS